MFTTLNGKALGLLVIGPVLHYLGVSSRGAADLLLGTALCEHACSQRRHAHGDRGDVGLYGITPAMHRAAWDRYLAFRPELASRVRGLASVEDFLRNPDRELVCNAAYATAIATVVYLATGEEIPASGEVDALGRFWWEHFHLPATGGHRDGVRQGFLAAQLAA